jgi:hypothetical protein
VSFFVVADVLVAFVVVNLVARRRRLHVLVQPAASTRPEQVGWV